MNPQLSYNSWAAAANCARRAYGRTGYQFLRAKQVVFIGKRIEAAERELEETFAAVALCAILEHVFREMKSPYSRGDTINYNPQFMREVNALYYQP